MADKNGFQFGMQVFVKDTKSFYNSPVFTGHLIKYDEEKDLYTVQVLAMGGMTLLNFELKAELLEQVPAANPLEEDEAAEDESKPKSFAEADDTVIETRDPDEVK